MAEHTPGPWRVLQWADEKKGFIAIVGSSEVAEHICDVFPFGRRAEGQTLAEHVANARLIASAPDLLAALKAVEEWWLADGMKHHEGAPYAIFAARKAIAKATGAA